MRIRGVIRGLLVVVVLAGPAGRARSDTWTNAAGDTFSAVPVEFDGRTVVFERTDGEKVSLRLFSLASDDQKRVTEVFRGRAVPAALEPAFRFAEGQLDRARASFQEGQIDDATYALRRERVIGSFKKSCASRSYAEESDEVQELVLRLMDR